MSKIIQAARLARELHDGQTRKYTQVPYLTHPIRVAGRTATMVWATEDAVCAAYLHDTMEDCAKTPNEQIEIFCRIGNQISPGTAELVKELTNPSKLMDGVPRADRKRFDREHLAKVSKTAQWIKLIDRIDNLNETLGDLKTGACQNFKFAILFAEETYPLLEAIGQAGEILRQEAYVLANSVELVARVMLNQTPRISEE